MWLFLPRALKPSVDREICGKMPWILPWPSLSLLLRITAGGGGISLSQGDLHSTSWSMPSFILLTRYYLPRDPLSPLWCRLEGEEEAVDRKPSVWIVLLHPKWRWPEILYVMCYMFGNKPSVGITVRMLYAETCRFLGHKGNMTCNLSIVISSLGVEGEVCL